MADDIKVNGLQVPVRLWDGMHNELDPPQLIDGRNRVAACEIAGEKFVYDLRLSARGSTDPEFKVLRVIKSCNLARRPLQPQQTAAFLRRIGLRYRDTRIDYLSRYGSQFEPATWQDELAGLMATKASERLFHEMCDAGRFGSSMRTWYMVAHVAKYRPDLLRQVELNQMGLVNADRLAKVAEDNGAA